MLSRFVWACALPLALLIARAEAAIPPLGGNTAKPTQPPDPVWPESFHATLHQNYLNSLGVIELYYDWNRKANLNIITQQSAEAKGSLYDLQFDSGDTYYFTPQTRECTPQDYSIGILTPDWLREAQYLGLQQVGIYLTHTWSKGESLDGDGTPFVYYHDDVITRRPVKWRFYTGRVIDVIAYTPYEPTPDSLWQVPGYCSNKTATTI